MARKQVGMVDAELLARVDERASVLGQTRRVFVERALEQALGDGQGGAAGTRDASLEAVPAPAEQPYEERLAKTDEMMHRIVREAGAPRHGNVGPKRSFTPMPKGGK